MTEMEVGEMSFLDEVKSVTKTPEQVANEKLKESIEKGRSGAKEDFERIKTEIKKRAEKGEYEVVGDARIIKFDFEFPTIYGMISYSYAWYDGIINKGIKCIIEDEVALNYYKCELERLARENNIKCKLLCRFRNDDASEYCFNIPGDYSAINNINTCHIQNVNRFSNVIRCSFTF